MTSELLDRLTEFPFRRLAARLAGMRRPPAWQPLDLGIGEPQHQPPALLAEAVATQRHLWNRYPPGQRHARAPRRLRRLADPPLRPARPARSIPTGTCCRWPATKEGLFMLASAAVPGRKAGQRPAVLMPNPVYAVYYGAAVMARAEPVLLPATADTGFLPDLDALDEALLDRTALFYLCTPANPQGAAADLDYLRRAVRLARRHDFLLAVDECYAEIWDKSPPPGALSAALLEDGSLRQPAWCCTRCRSARMPPACAPASSPATRISLIATFQAARLRVAGAAAAAAGRRHRPVARRGPRRGEPRSLPTEDRHGRASAVEPLRLLPPGRRLLPLARRRRRRGGGLAAVARGRPCACCPGSYLGAADETARQSRCPPISAWRWSTTTRRWARPSITSPRGARLMPCGCRPPDRPRALRASGPTSTI